MVLNRSFQDWQLTKTTIPERFKELLNLSQWTDCAFSVGDGDVELFRCHRLVLAVSSPVFEAMFYGQLADSDPSKVIPVPDIDPYYFKIFLGYLYSDSLELTNIEEAGALLYIAKKYMLPHLSKLCLDYLVEHTYIQNFSDVLLLAEKLDEDTLIKPCLKVMSKHRPDIWMPEVEHLSSYVLSRLLEQREMILSESEIWDLAVGWINKEASIRSTGDSVQKREIMLEIALLDKIDFKNLSDAEMKNVVLNCSFLEKEDIIKIMSYRDETVDRVYRFSPRECKMKSSREIIYHGDLKFLPQIPLATKIESTGRILVRGFDVFTRYAQCSGLYHEQMSVQVKKSNGELMTEFKSDSNVGLPFNSECCVLLPKPIWFEPSVEYTVVFEVSGMYQICICTKNSIVKRSLNSYFKFKDPDKINFPSLNGKMSFISGVYFSL